MTSSGQLPRFTFRPVTRDDIALMHRWLNLPHVKVWWGDNTSLTELAREYGEYIDGVEPIEAYIVGYEGREIGHTQWARYADYAWYGKILGLTESEIAGGANCDVFIGDASLLYRGLGSALVRQFTDEIIFADAAITTCFIDPEQHNHAAIRAYEKAGFTFVRDVADDGDGHTVHLMARQRPKPL